MLLLALMFLLVPPSQATEYHFRTVEVSFANTHDSIVTGLNDTGVSVGRYFQVGQLINGFRLQRPRGRFEPLPRLEPVAITNTDIIIGRVGTPERGFFLQDGTFTTWQVREPSPDYPFFTLASTTPVASNDRSITVGEYFSILDSQVHNFLYDPSTGEFVLFAFPGTPRAFLTGINNADQFTAVAFDPVLPPRSFLGDRTRQDLTPANLPDFPDGELIGLTDDGILAGNVGSVGFLVKDGVGQVIEVPGALSTDLQGIRNDLTVYGAYQSADFRSHGFIATPDGTRIVPRPDSAARLRPFTLADCGPGSKRLVCRAP